MGKPQSRKVRTICQGKRYRRGRIFPLAPRRRSTSTAVAGADVKCGSTKPSLTSNLALPNSREEKWSCLFFAVPVVTWRHWNTPGSKARPKGANLIFAATLYLYAETKNDPELINRI